MTERATNGAARRLPRAQSADGDVRPARLKRSAPAPPSTPRRLMRFDPPPPQRRPSDGNGARGTRVPRRRHTPRAGGPPVIEAAAVTVSFGGLTAVDDATLSIRRGTVTALIGPNGAGKTTLFNVLTGAQRPAAGRIRIHGTDVTGWSRAAIAGLGISRTFQNISLFDALPVLDNVLVGASRFVHSGLIQALVRGPGARKSERRARELARDALAMVGLEDAAGERAGDLPYGLRRRVEIARALAAEPSILLLDEPSAGMDAAETADLAGIVSDLVERLDLTLFLVEHDMSMVRDCVDHLFVLNFGRVVFGGGPTEGLRDPEVIAVYLGARDARDA